MSREWADDAGKRGGVEIRCVSRERSPEPLENDIILDIDGPGCGWRGTTRAVTQYGATTWEIEECPECGGVVEAVR